MDSVKDFSDSIPQSTSGNGKGMSDEPRSTRNKGSHSKPRRSGSRIRKPSGKLKQSSDINIFVSDDEGALTDGKKGYREDSDESDEESDQDNVTILSNEIYTLEEVQQQPDVVKENRDVTLYKDGVKLREIISRIDPNHCFWKWYLARHIRRNFNGKKPSKQSHYRHAYEGHDWEKMGPNSPRFKINDWKPNPSRLEFEAALAHTQTKRPGTKSARMQYLRQHAHAEYDWPRIVTEDIVDGILEECGESPYDFTNTSNYEALPTDEGHPEMIVTMTFDAEKLDLGGQAKRDTRPGKGGQAEPDIMNTYMHQAHFISNIMKTVDELRHELATVRNDLTTSYERCENLESDLVATNSRCENLESNVKVLQCLQAQMARNLRPSTEPDVLNAESTKKRELERDGEAKAIEEQFKRQKQAHRGKHADLGVGGKKT